MELYAALENKARSLGADLFGVADLSPYRDTLYSRYGEPVAAFPRAVCMAVLLPRRVTDELIDHPTHAYLRYYDAANSLLDQIALVTANQLSRAGFDSLPIPASQRSGQKDGGAFSHRLAAAAAGLGWIGKSCNLISPEAGPRLRLVTVLTDAPLPCGQAIAARCGDCQKCRDACPAKAILGQPFRAEDALSVRFDFDRCDEYLSETRQVFGKRICGRCIAACPHGK